MPKVTIDDITVEVPEGINVVDAAKLAGVEIPHYCYHPGLSIAGNCRMCLVEIEGMPGRGLPIACNTRVADGMVVKTNTDTVKKAREGVLEFLLINHPLDCPICDKAGECLLQDYSFDYGKGYSRMVEQREIMPKKDVSENIVLFADRCIMCTRCVRFCQEVTGTNELGVFFRGDRNEIDVFPGKPVDNLLSGNVIDICPVGALKSKHFLYQQRVWDLRSVPTTCSLCSTGCEIWADVRNNQIARVRGRSSDMERGPWICDIGRWNLDYVNSEERLVRPQIRNAEGVLEDATWDEAIELIEKKFREVASVKGAIGIGGLMSTWRSNEEAEAFKGFFEDSVGSPYYSMVPGRQGEEHQFPGGFIIESDKSPNTTGVGEILASGKDVFEAIERGIVKAVYFAAGEKIDPLSEEIKAELMKVDFLVVEDILPSDATALADVVLPGHAFSEKRGTIKNGRGQTRRWRNAMMPPRHARDLRRIVTDIARSLRAKREEEVGAEA